MLKSFSQTRALVIFGKIRFVKLKIKDGFYFWNFGIKCHNKPKKLWKIGVIKLDILISMNQYSWSDFRPKSWHRYFGNNSFASFISFRQLWGHSLKKFRKVDFTFVFNSKFAYLFMYISDFWRIFKLFLHHFLHQNFTFLHHFYTPIFLRFFHQNFYTNFI